MHEVISVACAHEPGHLAAHLYNVQELHVPYSKSTVPLHANSVFLDPRKVKGRVNYYPRLITVEYSGGYGYLSKFEFAEPKVDLNRVGAQVSARERVPKSEFQKLLDAGTGVSPSMLNTENTKYWTDYNKLIHKPTSLVELESHIHPLGAHKHFSKGTFEDYNVGVEEYKDTRDPIDDEFRRQLECLDNLQGVNFFTTFDNAWGGFTSTMLLDLRDEYFNNGVSSKFNLWVFALATKAKPTLTGIRSFMEFSKNATLVMPMSLDSYRHRNFDKESNWHRGAVYAALVNGIWNANNRLEKPIRMADIEAQLTKGNLHRTVANDLRLGLQTLGLTLGDEILSEVDISCDPVDAVTFPKVVTDFNVHLSQTTALRKQLQEYKKIAERARLPAHLETLGDKAEMVEDVSTLLQEYTLYDSDDEYQ